MQGHGHLTAIPGSQVTEIPNSSSLMEHCHSTRCQSRDPQRGDNAQAGDKDSQDLSVAPEVPTTGVTPNPKRFSLSPQSSSSNTWGFGDFPCPEPHMPRDTGGRDVPHMPVG